jgi:diaminopimelate epimerase
MGNPHAIFFVADVNAHELERVGPILENHPIFPERANISLVAVAGKDHLIQRVWERGAGLTLACGSGACAAAVAAARAGLTGRKVRVTLPGGDLAIEWLDNGHVLMSGGVATAFTGRLDPALLG